MYIYCSYPSQALFKLESNNVASKWGWLLKWNRISCSLGHVMNNVIN